MERTIGEIFKYNGEWYQCVEGKTICSECDLRNIICQRDTSINNPFKECSGNYRTDKKNIIFKKLEKVGKPYVGNNGTFQSYKLAMPIYGDIPDQNTGFTTTEVVIKQNKEDMEEKKIKLRQEDVDYIRRKFKEITQDYIIQGCDKEKVQYEFGKIFEPIQDLDNENLCKNLKSFSLEAAKQGKPVCTRDGRKARIICFDLSEEYPIVARVYDEDKILLFSYKEDGRINNYDYKFDLMMLPETHEGWVNVYKGGLLDTKSYPTQKEAFDKPCQEGYVDTVKICWEE